MTVNYKQYQEYTFSLNYQIAYILEQNGIHFLYISIHFSDKLDIFFHLTEYSYTSLVQQLNYDMIS